MKKSIRVKNKVFLSCITILMLAASVFTFSTLSSPVQASETGQIYASSSELKVTAFDRKGGEIDEFNPDGQIGGVNFFTYNWRSTSKFKVEFDTTGLTLTAPYSYKYSLQYLENTPNHFDNLTTVTEDIPNASDSNLTSLDQIPSIEYFIDKESGSPSLGHEWGIYRFTLTINNSNPYHSDFIYVAPDNPPTEEIEITKKNVQPDGDLKDATAYEFTITSDSCKYINKNLIRWYVKGKTYDGVQYAYHVDDIGSDEFLTSDYHENALHEATSEREKGSLTFKFETNLGGTWDVFCVVFKEVPASRVENIASAQSTRSNTINVPTGREFHASYIIWIIIGAAVLLLGVIIFVIIKSVKKEKVW